MIGVTVITSARAAETLEATVLSVRRYRDPR